LIITLHNTGCPTRYRNRLAGGQLLRVATIRRTTDTHYRHIPFTPTWSVDCWSWILRCVQ